MPNYPVHTIASVPENSKPALEQLQQAFVVLPNLAAAIANSPKLINSLVGVFQQVHSSSLTEQEIQIVLLTDAPESAPDEVLKSFQKKYQKPGSPDQA